MKDIKVKVKYNNNIILEENFKESITLYTSLNINKSS